MKKRILCICLTAVLLISLTGCSAADTLTQLSVTYESIWRRIRMSLGLRLWGITGSRKEPM